MGGLPGDVVKFKECSKLAKIVSVDQPKNKDSVKISYVHPSVFVKRDVYDEIQFDCNMKVASDFKFMLEAFERGKVFGKLDEIIVAMRAGGLGSKLNFEQSIVRMKKISLMSGVRHAFGRLLNKVLIKEKNDNYKKEEFNEVIGRLSRLGFDITKQNDIVE